MLVAPGVQGELGVLPRHTHLMAALQPGEIRLTNGKQVECYAISSGFIEVCPDKVLVLADAAEAAVDISVERAKRALERARKRLQEKQGGEVDFGRARLALMRAINRLKVSEGK